MKLAFIVYSRRKENLPLDRRKFVKEGKKFIYK